MPVFTGMTLCASPSLFSPATKCFPLFSPFSLLFLLIGACNPTPPAQEPALAATPVPVAAKAPATSQSAPSSEPSSSVAQDPALKDFVQEGRASYYSDKLHGRKTASGEPYDKRALTCAHRTLPFGTYIRVENLKNKKTVVVKVNDRGPHGGRRIIDVSRAAAEALDMIRSGTAHVRLTTLKAGDGQ